MERIGDNYGSGSAWVIGSASDEREEQSECVEDGVSDGGFQQVGLKEVARLSLWSGKIFIWQRTA
jgi:hypothetical protein